MSFMISIQKAIFVELVRKTKSIHAIHRTIPAFYTVSGLLRKFPLGSIKQSSIFRDHILSTFIHKPDQQLDRKKQSFSPSFDIRFHR